MELEGLPDAFAASLEILIDIRELVTDPYKLFAIDELLFKYKWFNPIMMQERINHMDKNKIAYQYSYDKLEEENDDLKLQVRDLKDALHWANDRIDYLQDSLNDNDRPI